jgi:hypothetical protein
MPRYNLNHQDVETLVSGLFHLSLNAESTKEHTRITNLRDRLLNKLNSEDSNPDDLDVWDAFK